MKPLLVGYAPVEGTLGVSHGVAFVGTDSGRRLARYAGLEPHELLDHVDAVNLHAEPDAEWVPSRASSRAQALWQGFVVPRGHRRVLLASSPVAEAFGRSYHPLFEWEERDGVQVAVIPHPSGLVRWWNSQENRDQARAFLVDALQLQER